MIPSPTPPASNDDGRRRPLARLLVGCLAVEATVVAVVLAATILGPSMVTSSATSPAPVSVEPAPGPATTEATVDGFLDAWHRSLEGDFAVAGTLTRVKLGDQALYTSTWPDLSISNRPTASWSYRRARSADRELTQIGDVAVITDPVGGRRTCLRRSPGFVCAPDGDSGGGGGDSAPMTSVQAAVRGPEASHRVADTDPIDIASEFPALPPEIDCWETRSLTDGLGQRWGRRAQFCFDIATGAPVFRRILEVSRIEVMVADVVSSTVAAGDLEPS